jgi:uncharacterized membrane protein YhiD involved in acid resistance
MSPFAGRSKRALHDIDPPRRGPRASPLADLAGDDRSPDDPAPALRRGRPRRRGRARARARGSAAGLRTHALVCLGAALSVIVSTFGFRDAGHAQNIVLDPSRVAAQVISGIGFLGAGVIIFHKEIIRGLTTAASLWVVAAVGLAVGGGLYAAAVATSALALAILAVMKPLERRLTASRLRQLVTVGFDRRKNDTPRPARGRRGFRGRYRDLQRAVERRSGEGSLQPRAAQRDDHAALDPPARSFGSRRRS